MVRGPVRGHMRGQMRVLVTGFRDFLGDDVNASRCRDNPACRLLAHVQDADTQMLPASWNAGSDVRYEDYDVVIHVGLGVYDSTTYCMLERGAYNLVNGSADATGHAPTAGPIEHGASLVLDSMPLGRVASVAADAGRCASHSLRVVEAREANAYVCNRLHWNALRRVADPTCRCAEAYFVHVPYPRRDEDYSELGLTLTFIVHRVCNVDTFGESFASSASLASSNAPRASVASSAYRSTVRIGLLVGGVALVLASLR